MNKTKKPTKTKAKLQVLKVAVRRLTPKELKDAVGGIAVHDLGCNFT